MSPTTRRPDLADMLAAIDLRVLLDELTQTAASPGERRWHCPLADHDDRHPSVTMFTDRRGHQRWRCWSGDDTHRGDAIDLVTVTQHLTRSEAITWLATRHHLDLDQPGDARPRTPPREPASVPTTSLSSVVVDYARRCADLLWTPSGEPVREWLHQRCFDDEILRANHVGADPGYRQLPRRYGLPKGTSPAATFPAQDASGAVTYVQTRYLDPGDRPKYDNPAARLGPNPRIAWTRVPAASTPRAGVLIVCEGIPDALTAAQAGYRAVALLGSHAANEHTADRVADHARRHHLAIVAVVDPDPAGRAAGQRLMHHLAARGRHLHIVEPATGTDLNHWAQQNPQWHQTIDLLARHTSRGRGLDL
jgi:DNA primase